MINDINSPEEENGKNYLEKMGSLNGKSTAEDIQKQNTAIVQQTAGAVAQSAFGQYAIEGTREAYEEERRAEYAGADTLNQFSDMMRQYENSELDAEAWGNLHTRLVDDLEGGAPKWVTGSASDDAWEAAGDMMADEQLTLLGTDQYATGRAMFMSGSNSMAAKAWGLNDDTDWLMEQATSRGLDLNSRADLLSTLKGVISGNALFSYDSYAEALGGYVDKNWNKEAKDLAWASMNSTAIGQDMAKAINLTREGMDRFNSREAMTYSANRTIAEQNFAAFAATDSTAGAATMLARMGPSLMNDPDMIGELVLAAAATAVSGGAAGAGWLALKGAQYGLKGGLMAKKAAFIIKQASKVSRFTPSRVTGDLIIPMSRAWRNGKGLNNQFDRARHAWQNMDKYDSWTTFLAGAAGDGTVGGAAQYMLSLGGYDALNELHYGKGNVPTGAQMGTFLERAGMGMFGGMAFGSALRGTMGGVTKAGLSLVEGNAAFKRVLAGMDGRSADATAAEAIMSKTFDEADASTEVVVIGERSEGTSAAEVAAEATAKVVNRSEAAGASPTRVASRIREEVAGMKIDMSSPEARARIDGIVNDAIAAEANTRGARIARYNAKAETEAAAIRGETGSQRQERLRHAQARAQEVNRSVLVKAAADGVDPNNKEAVATWVEVEGDRVSEADAANLAKLESEAEEAASELRRTQVQEKWDARAAKREAAAPQKPAKAPEADSAPATRSEPEAAETSPEASSVDADRAAQLSSREYTVERLKEMLRQLGGKPGKLKKAELAAKIAELEASKGSQLEIDWDAQKQAKGSKKTRKEAGKEQGQAASKLLEAKVALANKLNVPVDELDALIVLNIAKRQAASAADAANTIVDMYVNADRELSLAEAFAYLRNMMGGEIPSDEVRLALFPDGAADGKSVSPEGMRAAIKLAQRELTADLGARAMDDPFMGQAYASYIRHGYQSFLDSMKEYKEEVRNSVEAEQARYTLARKNRHAMSDEDLRIFLGKEPVEVDGKEYFEKAMARAAQLAKDIDAADTELIPGWEGDISVKARLMADAKKLTADVLRQELMTKYGYNMHVLKSKGFNKKELESLYAAHQYLGLVDEAFNAGRLSEGESALRFREATHLDTQKEMLRGILGTVQAEIERLKRFGHGGDLTMTEGDVLSLMPPEYTGLRDGLFGSARGYGVDKNKFDLIRMQEIAAQRLAMVDEDFRARQIAAAQKKLEELESESGTDAAIQARQYRSKIKALNERNLVADEVVPGVKAVHEQIRNSMDSTELAEHALREEGAMIDGIVSQLFDSGKMSGDNRLDALRQHGIVIAKGKKKMTDAERLAWQQTQAKNIINKLDETLKAEYDFSLRDLVNGNEGMYDGRLVGRAAVEMLVGRRYSGDSVAVRSAQYKGTSDGSERAVMTGDNTVRDPNPLGNMKVRQFVDDLNKMHEQAVHEHILFNEDGTLRKLDDNQLDEMEAYYEGLRDLSDEELEARLQDWTYDVNPRTRALVTRTVSDSPLKEFRTPKQMVAEATERMYMQAPGYTQHVHDDVIVLSGSGAVGDGTITALWGAIGDQLSGKASPKGAIAGAGAGWKTLATTPGSLSDFINVRTEAIWGNFEGMAELARFMGMSNLRVLKEDSLKGLTLLNEGKGDADKLTAKELEQIAEATTLVEVENAIGLIMEATGERYKNGISFKEYANNWDASSQAVNLAKAMMSAYEAEMSTDAGAKFVVDNLYTVLGISREKGAISDQLHNAIYGPRSELVSINRYQEGDAAGNDLVEAKADYYAEVWDNEFGNIQNWSVRAGNFVGADDFGSPFPKDYALAERLAKGWKAIYDAAGPMKSETKSALAGHIRNGLMKKPVMTRGYGAQLTAIRGSTVSFLRENLASFTSDAPSAEAKALFDALPEDLVNELVADSLAHNFSDSGMVFKFAHSLAAAMADRAKDVSKIKTGGMLAAGLGLPDAATFRDAVRSINGLNDVMITRARRKPGETDWDEDVSAPLVIDDLLNSDPGVAKQVNDAAMAETDRRFSKGLNPELAIGLGRWFLRNRLHAESGVATKAQIRSVETRMLNELSGIIEDTDMDMATKERAISEWLDNWGTKQSSETVQAMSRSFFAPKSDVVNPRIKETGVGPHLSPMARAQTQHGLLVHSTAASSAGRTWTSLGMSNKRGATRAEVHGEEFDETLMVTESRLADPAVEYGKMTPEDRKRMIRQLALQDLAMQMGGIVKPAPMDGVAYKAPTTGDVVAKWADIDGDDGPSIRERKAALGERIYSEEKDTSKDLTPDEVLNDSFVNDTNPFVNRSFFSQEGDEFTDLGVPQLLVAALDRSADLQARSRVAEAARGDVSGPGIRASELVAPAPVEAPDSIDFSPRSMRVRPDTDFGRYKLEEDATAFELATMREVIDYARENGIGLDSKKGKLEAWEGLMVERALIAATDDMDVHASRLLKADHDGVMPLTTVAGMRELNAAFEVKLQGLLRDVYGDGLDADSPRSRSLGVLESEPAVFPARNQLEALQNLARAGSTENLDTLLGPAPFANLVLKGSATVNSRHLVGLMPKSVFHSDFSVLGGAIEQNLRFAQWFLMRKTGMSAQEVSADFIELWKNRMDADQEGLKRYEAEYAEWKDNGYKELDGMAKVDPTGDWVSMSAYRNYLKENPGDAALIKKMTGHDIAEMDIDQLREVLFKLDSDDPEKKPMPEAFLDGLGRDLIADKVDPGTVVWRTHSQLRKLMIDPKSQPMVHRMWMAWALNKSIGDNLNLREGFGAVKVNGGSRMFSHAPDTPERIRASRKGMVKAVFGDKGMPDKMEMSGAIGRFVEARGSKIAKILEDTYGLSRVDSDIAFMFMLANRGQHGSNVNPEAIRAKFVALVSGNSKEFGLPRAVDLDAAMKVFDEIMLKEAKADYGVIKNLMQDPSINPSARINGGSRFGEAKAVLDSRTDISESGREVGLTEIVGDEGGEAILGARFEAPAEKLRIDQAIKQVAEAGAEAEGKHDAAQQDLADKVDDGDPVFGEGRTLWNETDDATFKKRYPSVHALVNKLNEMSVFKNADEARKFAVMAMMNGDVLEGMLPNIRFEYTGEAGFARATNVEDAAGQLRGRVEVLKNMTGMDATSAFDVMVHEIGHVAITRALADSSSLNKQLTSLVSEARNQLGSAEGRAMYLQAFVAIHGAKRGNVMFENLLKAVNHEGRGAKRSAFDAGMQEVMAQLYAWRMLSKVGDDVDVTVPFHKHISLVNDIAGSKVRKLIHAFNGRRVKGESSPFFGSDSRALIALDRVIMYTAQSKPFFRNGDSRIQMDVAMNSPANIAAYKTEVIELREKIKAEADPDARKNLTHELRIREARIGEHQMRVDERPSPQQIAAVVHSADPTFTERSLRTAPDFLEGETLITGLGRDHGLIHLDTLHSDAKHHVVRDRLSQHFTGRHETLFHDSALRSKIDAVGQGIAMQGISAPWKVEDSAVNAMASLMNPFIGLQNRTGANALQQGISLQQIQTSWQANWGPTLSKGIELTKLVEKNPELAPAVNEAFRRVFHSKDATEARGHLDALAAIGGKSIDAANLLEDAVSGFRVQYETTLDMARNAGMIDQQVRTILSDSPELPLSLSKEAKNTNAPITAARALAAKMQKQLLDRATAVDGDHMGYVDADTLYMMGLVGDYKNVKSGDVQSAFEATMDSNPKMVEDVMEYGAKRYEDLDDGETSQAELFNKYSTMIVKDIREGKIRFEQMSSYMQAQYIKHLEAGSVEPGASGRALASLDPKNEADAQILNRYDVTNRKDSALSPLEVRGAQLYSKMSFGGYVHADSRLIATADIRQALGSDAWNDNPMEVMMQMAKGIGFEAHERSVSQHHFGIKGFGMMDALDNIEAELNAGTVMFGGEARHADPATIEAHKAAIEELRKQYRMASMRAASSNPQDAADQWLSKVAPYLAIPVQMVTSPNWSIASLAVEGAGGVLRGIMQAATGQTKSVVGNASKMGKSAMRDDLHNIGLALPYHLTSIGFGYQWVLDASGTALDNIDPTANKTGAQKTADKIKKISNFAFEWSQLKTRSMRLLPAQQKMVPFLNSRHGEPSKVAVAAKAVTEAVTREPNRAFTNADIYKIAREAGINDKSVVKELWDMGAFDEGVARSLTQLADSHLNGNQPIDWPRIQDWVHTAELPRGLRNAGDYEVNSAATAAREKAATVLQQLIFQEINKSNLEPQVGSTIVAETGFKRLWSQLGQYSIMAMKMAMATGGLGAGALLTWLVPLMMGETVYYVANQAKSGKRPDHVMAEMAADPLGHFLQIASRFPFFGAGTFASQYLIDNSLSVAAGMLPEGAPLSSYQQARTGAISSPGMPAPQMMMSAIQGVADAARHVATVATASDSAELDAAKSGLVDGAARFTPIDLRQMWAPVLRALTGEWKSQEGKSSGQQSSAGRFLTEAGVMDPAPQGSDVRERANRRKRLENVASSMMDRSKIKRAEASAAPEGSPPSKGAATSQAPTTGLSGPAAGKTEGFAPESASSALSDKL